MSAPDWPPCDTCGEPSTSTARDVLEIYDPMSPYRKKELGPLKCGCAGHPVESNWIEAGEAEIDAGMRAAIDRLCH